RPRPRRPRAPPPAPAPRPPPCAQVGPPPPLACAKGRPAPGRSVRVCWERPQLREVLQRSRRTRASSLTPCPAKFTRTSYSRRKEGGSSSSSGDVRAVTRLRLGRLGTLPPPMPVTTTVTHT